MRSPLFLQLVAHLLINANLLTSYVSVFMLKNIPNSFLSWSKSTENNPWYRLLCFSASHGFHKHFLFLVFKALLCFALCFINCEHTGTAQIVPIFFFFKCPIVTSHTLDLTLFTSTLFRISFEFLFLNLYLGALFYKKIKEKKKNHKKYGKLW